jgi:hypothetical protein
MNKTISLAAIVMVAVIMGMSAFAPAAMGARDGPRGNATDAVCHLGGQATEELEDDLWFVLFVNSNAVAGHVEDGDTDIADDGSEDADCLARNEA